jgi:hypothetical protein
MRFPGFIGGSGRTQSPIAGVERTLNWYPEIVEGSAPKAERVLYPVPGVSLLVTAAEGPGRGIFTAGARCFCVLGFVFYEVAAVGALATLTNRGTVVYDPTPVQFAFSDGAGTAGQVMVASAGYGYVFDLATNVLTLVLDPGAGDYRADQIGFTGGRFLALDSVASVLSISAQLDGLTWDPSLVSQRTNGEDRWVALLVTGLEFLLMGERTSEFWYNAGTSPFPFAPIQGAFLHHGTPAAASLGRIGATPFWIGQNEDGSGMVYAAGDGFAARRISTHAVEYALQQGAVTDAVSWTYQDGGHTFYVLSLPAARITWVYDAATGTWHERATWDVVRAREEAWRPCFHAYAFGKHLVMDRDGNGIYEMSAAYGFDVGSAAIRRVRRAPHVASEQRRMFVSELTVHLETGLGLSSGQGSDPIAMLRLSKDGGKTWGNERHCSAGRQGEYKARVCWPRLGAGRDLVFELAVSDPIPWRVVDAYLDVEAGAH